MAATVGAQCGPYPPELGPESRKRGTLARGPCSGAARALA